MRCRVRHRIDPEGTPNGEPADGPRDVTFPARRDLAEVDENRACGFGHRVYPKNQGAAGFSPREPKDGTVLGHSLNFRNNKQLHSPYLQEDISAKSYLPAHTPFLMWYNGARRAIESVGKKTSQPSRRQAGLEARMTQRPLTTINSGGWHGQVILPVASPVVAHTGKITCPCHPNKRMVGLDPLCNHGSGRHSCRPSAGILDTPRAATPGVASRRVKDRPLRMSGGSSNRLFRYPVLSPNT